MDPWARNLIVLALGLLLIIFRRALTRLHVAHYRRWWGIDFSNQADVTEFVFVVVGAVACLFGAAGLAGVEPFSNELGQRLGK